VFAIAGVAAFYEIFEWQYAVRSDPTAGIAVLGSQGDIWDAQKDMLADSLGAVAGVALYILLHRRWIQVKRVCGRSALLGAIPWRRTSRSRPEGRSYQPTNRG